MFTTDQINSALNKVKTGKDLPEFVSALKALGVKRSDVYIMNGMAIYFGTGDETVESAPVYENLIIAEQSDEGLLQQALAAYHSGTIDFQTFCRQAADAGVEKWVIDVIKTTITYLNMAGNELFVKKIKL